MADPEVPPYNKHFGQKKTLEIPRVPGRHLGRT